MFGNLFRSKPSPDDFLQSTRGFARRCGFTVVGEDRSVPMIVLRHNGKFDDYPVFMALADDGQVLARVRSRHRWPGAAPCITSALMERLDRDSRCVSFDVDTGDDGVTKMLARLVVPRVALIDGKEFDTATSEMISGMYAADEYLDQNGY